MVNSQQSEVTPGSDQPKPRGSKNGQDAEGQNALFENEAIQQTVAEDPLLKFFNENWRQIVVIVAVIAGGFYTKNVFEETYAASMRRAASVFGDARKQFISLKTSLAELKKLEAELKAPSDSAESDGEAQAAQADKPDEKKLAEVRTTVEKSEERLMDLLRALQDEREPYRSLGSIYRALLSHQKGDIEAMQAQLNSFDWRAASSDSKERYFAELASLALARAQLDVDSMLESGKSLLSDLGQNGSYVRVGAALTLARIAVSAEERKSAAALLEDIAKENPEQLELIQTELDRLQASQ